MRTFCKILIGILFGTISANAIDVNYGYNAHGQYVPTSYGNQQVQYGYNAHGQYVPTSYGNQKVQYGYNAHGQYVPRSIGN